MADNSVYIEKEGKELKIAKETQKLNWYEFPPGCFLPNIGLS
jgi:hypothetical protein